MALSKTGRFLSKAEILGVGVFSPLPILKRDSAKQCRIVSRNAAVHLRRKAQEGKEWLCPKFGHENLSCSKGRKHRFPHELCGKICYCSWPPNKLFTTRQITLLIIRERKLNTNFFAQTFRAPPGCPGKSPGYPAKRVWIPWLRGTYRTFWPPPLHVKETHPTGRFPDQKVWVWVPFFFPELFTTWEITCAIQCCRRQSPAG